MIFLENFSFIAVLLAGIFSLLILILSSWRRCLAAFAFLSLPVAWLCAISLSPSMAGIKLLVVVMAAVMLAAAPEERELRVGDKNEMPGKVFRLMTALLVLIVIIPLEQGLEGWVPGSANIRLGGMLLIGMGLLQLGFSNRPGRAILGLLTFLTGFEILYSALESSLMITGLLAVITLGLAFTGAFLLNSTEAGEIP